MSKTIHRKNSFVGLAHSVLASLRQGELTFGDVFDLGPLEIASLSETARRLRRANQIDQAIQIVGTIIFYDPFNATHWDLMADLLERREQPALAVICYQVLAALQHRGKEAIHREASCLLKIGQPKLAEQVSQLWHSET